MYTCIIYISDQPWNCCIKMPSINKHFSFQYFSVIEPLTVYMLLASAYEGDVLASLLCHFLVCVHIWFCVWVCESAFRWMNYPLPTFRLWQSSISHPLRTLVSQSLSLRTLPCVVCNGFFTEMSEWPLKRISAFLFTMSMIEVLFWCRW